MGIEPGSFIYFNSTYNDTYRISSELNARTTFEDNSLGKFMRSEGVFYPVGTKLKMGELPQKWMNFGGYLRFLEHWGFNYNVFAASERRVGGFKGFEENADPDQRKIGVGIKKYPADYEEVEQAKKNAQIKLNIVEKK